MKTKDWGAFFLLAIGLAAVWFYVSGKAGKVWAAISGNTNAANPSGSDKTMQNAGSPQHPNYTPPATSNPLLGPGISIPMGYATPNASQSPLTQMLQTTSPGLTNTQASLGNGFNLARFAPPVFVNGYANRPMYNDQPVSFN